MKKIFILFIIFSLVIGSVVLAKNGIGVTKKEDVAPTPEFIFPKDGSEVKKEVELKLKVKGASLVEFYLQDTAGLISTYLGKGSLSGEQLWTLVWNTANCPNGYYKIFAQITNNYGQYSGEKIEISVNNEIKKDIEKEKGVKKEVEEMQEEIKKSEEKIKEGKEKAEKEIKEEIKKAAEEVEKNVPEPEKKSVMRAVEEKKNEAETEISEKTEKVAEASKKEEKIKKEIENKEKEKKEIEREIEKSEKELEELPEAPLESVKKDREEKLTEHQTKKEEVEQKIESLKEEKEKVSKEKETLKKEIVETVEKVAEPAEKVLPEKASQIVKIKEEVGEKVEKKVQELEALVSGEEKVRIEKTETLLRDSDGDGLSDEEEIRLGTNPFNPDSDADGFLDGGEIFIGYNPLKAGPADKIVYQDPRKVPPKESDVYTVEKVEKTTLPDGSPGLKLAGKGLPNSFITLHIFSLPVVVTVKTDGNGYWEYVLDKPITDGEHTVYATVTNNQGEIAARSEAFVFMATGEKVFRIFQSPQLAAEVVSPAQSLQRGFAILVAGIIVFGVGMALILIGILTRKKQQL